MVVGVVMVVGQVSRLNAHVPGQLGCAVLRVVY